MGSGLYWPTGYHNADNYDVGGATSTLAKGSLSEDRFNGTGNPGQTRQLALIFE